ncbi:MAG: uracil-DNA glycosylase [SAR324 cluster bacterium]|uniref:Type-4 uracil-DNA glycosylase n=1 Tax=SAR324 cluster bacterium TaxID=2024889 RepID=A0A2A4TBE4_9DELT|nr:MAG: uracil-DNA glycosylase [SAR324 cluster bacterium]
MQETFSSETIKQLEATLRFWGGSTSHLFLEPTDTQLLQELGELYQEEANQQPEAETVREIAHREPSVSTHAPRQAVPQGQTQVAAQVKTQGVPQAKTQAEPEAKKKQAPALDLRPENAHSLDSLRLRIRGCDRCKLCQGRKTIVSGQGNQKADLVFVGEAPGEEEDNTGLAFVGRAGQLLTQIIQSIGINRESAFICNVVKCRPPGNRNPQVDEIAACLPFLFKQLELLQPKVIVTLGNVATKALIPQALGIMKMRGKISSFQGIPVIPTFHPSFLLRQPAQIEAVWDDMRLIRQVLFQNTITTPIKIHQPGQPAP